MSYVSVYENTAPRTKVMILVGAVHVAIIVGVIAMPGIEIPDKSNSPFIATQHTEAPTVRAGNQRRQAV
jgi:hypothetical protein